MRGNYSLVNLNAMPETAKLNPLILTILSFRWLLFLGIIIVVVMWNNLQSTRKNTPALQSQVTAKQALITANTKAVADLTQQNRTTQAQIAPIVASAQIFPDKISSLASARALTQRTIGKILSLRPDTVSFSSISYSASSDTISGTSGTDRRIF